MTDVSLTLQNGETINIYAYQEKRCTNVFVWQHEDGTLTISVPDRSKGFDIAILTILNTGEIVIDKK